MVDFSLTDEQREVARTARAFAEREIAPRIHEMDCDLDLRPNPVREDGRGGLPGPAHPRAVRRVGDGLHRLRPAVRGDGARRHRVPGRPQRPHRAELADPPPVGERGAEAAVPRPAGPRREAGQLRAHRAGGRAAMPPTCRPPPAAMGTDTSSTAARSGSAWPIPPTSSSSSRPSTRPLATRASPPSSWSAASPDSRATPCTASWGSARATPGSCTSPTARSPPPTGWARRGRASRSR